MSASKEEGSIKVLFFLLETPPSIRKKVVSWCCFLLDTPPPIKKKKKKTFGKCNKALSLPQLNAIGQHDGRKGNLLSESVESVLPKKENSREEGWSVRLPTLNSENLISKIPPRPSTDETLEHFPAIETMLKH
ncbi:uncharacterized protein LOC143254562 isoform X2 [Tachypleus tridentatus]|uniref:uncharacterized protein LOC143254562 isoform X2 n=1 Tax=Tachypleus tridentatus TaxID=6853 RepID=UPI003FD66CB3